MIDPDDDSDDPDDDDPDDPDDPVTVCDCLLLSVTVCDCPWLPWLSVTVCDLPKNMDFLVQAKRVTWKSETESGTIWFRTTFLGTRVSNSSTTADDATG